MTQTLYAHMNNKTIKKKKKTITKKKRQWRFEAGETPSQQKNLDAVVCTCHTSYCGKCK
jgi:hypothetical protein